MVTTPHTRGLVEQGAPRTSRAQLGFRALSTLVGTACFVLFSAELHSVEEARDFPFDSPTIPFASSRMLDLLDDAVETEAESALPDLVHLVEVPSWAGDDPGLRSPLPEALLPASEALLRGQGQRALLLLDRAEPEDLTTPGGRFLHAEALKSAGRCEEAAAKYEEVLLLSPILDDRVRLQLADCLLSIGKVREAAAALLDLPEESRHHGASLRLRARALLLSGDPLGAIDTLRGGLAADARGREASEAHLLLGLARRKLGDPVRALDHLRLAVLAAPQEPHAAEAAAAALEIVTEVRKASEAGDDAAPHEGDPRFSASAARAWSLLCPALGQRDSSRRLAALAADRAMEALRPLVTASRGSLEAFAGRHESALNLFSEAASLASRHVEVDRPPLSQQWLIGSVGSLASREESQGPPPSTVHSLGPLMLDPDLAARARREAARAAMALGRNSQARALLESVAAEHPEHPLSPTVRLEAARLAIRARDFQVAAAKLEGLLLIQPVGPERPQALFLLGWAHFRLDRFEQAARFFEAAAFEAPAEAAFEDSYGGSAIASAARSFYWSGRAKAMAGEEEKAEAAWMRVLSNYPLSYYAELSGRRLGVGGSVAIADNSSRDLDLGLPLDPRVLRAGQFLDIGWRDEAGRELASMMARPASTDGRSLIQAAELMKEMGRVAAARGLYRGAALHGSADLSPASREAAWQFAFPLRYQEIIEREAGRWGYSPWLLFGLVLRESGFAPCARSHVGARGLAQIMMPTAKDSAADLRLAPPTPELLCDPEYNLRLGAWHLRKLLRRYQGSEILALAAYNAGQGSVDRWLARAGDLPLDAFVEEIPFEETRAYVRMVISASRGYAWTWGDAGGERFAEGSRRACRDRM